MQRLALVLHVAWWFLLLAGGLVMGQTEASGDHSLWPQWRGPKRDGQSQGDPWPERLSGDALVQLWRVPLGPSYSGPIVAGAVVYTTETRDKESEIVYAIERATGRQRWRAEWKGAMTVPFFAAANGSWIRSTPAYDGERLYVAGMRDVLVCLDAKTGAEVWRKDFVAELQTPLPDFGFVCSPLVDGDAVYVQAGASVAKLDKKNGAIIWRSLKDQGGMYGSAFSSPVIATLGGQRQLVVQTRAKLAGIHLDTGEVLWSKVVPAFRGMNILTPLVVDDAVFTSSCQNKSWLYRVSRAEERFTVAEAWTNNAQGYMSSPVVIAGHAYVHLQNQRLTCIDLKTGQRTWTSNPLGKYCSLVARGDRVLALDQRGILLLFKADPRKYELLDSRQISDDETWAHLAVCGDELYVRELNALTAYRWRPGKD